MNEKINLVEEATKLSSLIATARKLAAAGTLADITALASNSQKLCEFAIRAPQNEETKNLLNRLLDELDSLALDLKNAFNWLSSPTEISSLRTQSTTGDRHGD